MREADAMGFLVKGCPVETMLEMIGQAAAARPTPCGVLARRSKLSWLHRSELLDQRRSNRSGHNSNPPSGWNGYASDHANKRRPCQTKTPLFPHFSPAPPTLCRASRPGSSTSVLRRAAV